MPRTALQDKLRVYPFWLLDVAPIEPLALPIFTPLFGFSSITGPEMTIETHEVREGNWPFPTSVVKQAKVGTISLARGATFFDSDFWRWMLAALTGDTEGFQSRAYGVATALAGTAGNQAAAGAATALAAVGGIFGFPRIGGPSYRRNLMLMHFFSHAPQGAVSEAITGGFATEIASTALIQSNFSPGLAAGLGLAGLGSLGGGTDPFSRLPAKAWMLKGCIPTRYKAAGDFDASSSEVSIQELDIEVDYFEEISLAS